MKVVCVDSSDNNYGGSGHDNFWLVEGNIYNVKCEALGFYQCGLLIGCYELIEDENFVYEKFRFIPLSEIDETEMINQKENVTI